LDQIKHIFAAYGKWITAILAPLGVWGVFVLTFADAALMGLPLDILVSAYIYRDPSHYLLYVVLATTGSATGCIVLYIIGYTGGEVLLRKRMSPERFEKIRASFDRHEFWALMFPAMLPPPVPFKAVVLAAAVFEMRFTHFLLAILAGRFIRFAFEGYIVIKFGPPMLNWLGHLFAHHFKWVLIAVAVGLVLWLWHRRRQAAIKQAGEKKRVELEPPALHTESDHL